MTSTVLYCTRNKNHGYAVNVFLTFAYLVFFRVRYDCAQTHGILMQMALRVISLSADFSTKCCALDRSNGDRNCVHCALPNSIPMIFGYLWCYVGLLITPVIRFRTYEHYINGYFELPRKQRKILFTELMKIVAVVMPVALVMHFVFSVEYAGSDAFVGKPAWFKIVYITMASLSFRCRLQVGLLLGEASAVALGLGLYPGNADCRPEAGPIGSCDTSVKKLNAMTVYSVRPSVELEVTFRSFIKKWNCTVQGWLARCVYKQFSGPKAFRFLSVFLLSGFWHGIYAGHWLFFVQVGLYIMNGEVNSVAGNAKRTPYLVQLLIHNVAFGYWLMPYLILDISKIWQIYSSVYFFGHFLLLTSVLFRTCRTVLQKRS